MKILLIYPPQWIPTSPHLSVPLLAGQLRANGYEADTLDLNVRFYNRILKSDHLSACLRRVRNEFGALQADVFTHYPDALTNFHSYDAETKTKLLRFKKMQAFLEKNDSELERTDTFAGSSARFNAKGKYLTLDEIVEKTDQAVSVLRSKTDFYDPEKLFDAKMILQEALKIASLPYAPNELIWDNYFCSPFLPMDWKNIDMLCKSAAYNMFLDFFEQSVREYDLASYDAVCISVPDLSQIPGAFTLSRILKKETDAFVAVGGNYITQNKKEILAHPEIFDEYADLVMTGDGELSIVRLAAFLEGKIPREEIFGAVFKREDGAMFEGAEAPRLKMNEVARAYFDDTDFSLYFTPEIVLPFQFSKGCYWGKCTFCDYYYGQQCFDIISAEHAADEMEAYAEKFGISNFLVIDEAIPPAYYARFADELLRRGLKVNYYSFARLEKGFDSQTLKKMHASGCRILMWGYECSAPRLIEKMNKGIDPAARLEIMRRSHEAGIWNNALFIIGFPTETMEEINETLRVVFDNRDIINSCTPSNFSLKKNAAMIRNAAENGIKRYAPLGEFYTVYDDEIDGVSRAQRREIRRGFHLDFITRYQNCLWPVVYSDFDSILLYLARFGLDHVTQYRSVRAICPMFR